MAADLKSAQAFYAELAGALKAVPPYIYAGPDSEKQKRQMAIDALRVLIESKGGAVRKDWQGSSVRLFGVRATSTSELPQAVRNWLNQVTLKSMAANNAERAG